MEAWKRNLYVCWAAVFIVSSGMSQMAPIIPLYIEHLGVHDIAEISRWSGIILGGNFISLAIFSPIWGRFGDRFGRKSMILRASLWLSMIVTCMGFVTNVYQLAALRILQGCLSGFQAAAITLVATQTPKARVGWALGLLFSGQVGGNLLGPLFGGYLAEVAGFRENFMVMGVMCGIAFITSYFFITESKTDTAKQTMPTQDQAVWQLLTRPQVTLCLFATTMVMQLGLMSIQPVITVYISQISGDVPHLALIAGTVFAASGLASMVAGPRVGRLSDRIGPHKVLLAALVMAGLLFIPQAFVQNAWQLGLLRFLLGVATAGLLPAINSLIKRSTPDQITGRIYGYNQSAQFIGMFIGAVMGGQIAAAYGIQSVLLLTGTLLLSVAVFVYNMIYKQYKH